MSEPFNLSFSLKNVQIKLKPPVSLAELSYLEDSLGNPLPPSFRWWLSQHREAVFDIGNLLEIFPPSSAADEFGITSQAERFRTNPNCHLKELIVFGKNGVDGETWAFYTGCTDSDGEYPIVWLSPGAMDSEGYVFANTRFDRFLNCQINFLLAVEQTDMDDEQADKEYQSLYQRFEPIHRPISSNNYQAVLTAASLRRQLMAFYSKDVS